MTLAFWVCMFAPEALGVDTNQAKVSCGLRSRSWVRPRRGLPKAQLGQSLLDGLGDPRGCGRTREVRAEASYGIAHQYVFWRFPRYNGKRTT